MSALELLNANIAGGCRKQRLWALVPLDVVELARWFGGHSPVVTVRPRYLGCAQTQHWLAGPGHDVFQGSFEARRAKRRAPIRGPS